jgi:hypothetical protein
MGVFGRVLVAAALLGGCTTGRLGTGSETLAGAAATSAAAVGAALAERASGNCIAICTAGTQCNRNTGLCEPMPCRGECGPNEHCEQTFSGEKCVAGGPTSVETLVKGSTPVVPASVLPATAPPRSGSPTIVPAAEQSSR